MGFKPLSKYERLAMKAKVNALGIDADRESENSMALILQFDGADAAFLDYVIADTNQPGYARRAARLIKERHGVS